MKIIFLIIIIVSLTSIASYSDAEMGHGVMRHKGEKSKQELETANYKSNGEQIYYVGISDRSGTIPFKAGAMWLRMHGGSCVNCHGTSGMGGFPIMMEDIIPPDIRYKKLTEEEHMHNEKKEVHKRYTDNLIKRAITKGINADGKTLNPIMPRYRMNEEDLDDLINYLKTLK